MKKFLSITIALLLVLSCVFVLAACKDKIADNTEHFDDITKTLKLSEIYDGKNFLQNGIGTATVSAYVDGDTTRFTLPSRQTITIRYFEVNTPESTGQVEKWGKAASDFTKSRLSQAETIVLQSTTGGAPTHDSYGVRYLGYVWYSLPGEDLRCLNLELVENGYSKNEGVEDPEHPYFSYFAKAEKFARGFKSRLFSDLADPLYHDEAIVTTIKEINENLAAIVANPGESNNYFNVDSRGGAKVQFEGYLESLRISNSGTYTFTAVQYDRDTGESYRINVYAAYTSSYASNMKVGDLFKIVGNIQEYPTGALEFQVSGINYNTVEDGKDTTFLKQSNYYMSFDSSLIADGTYVANYSKNCFGDLTITEAGKVENDVLTFKGSAKRHDGTTKEFTITVKVAATFDASAYTVGKTVTTRGLQYESGTNVITVLDSSNITIK